LLLIYVGSRYPYPHRSPCPSSARFPGDLFELRRAGARIRHPGRKAFSLRSVVGDRGHFGLRHASSGLSPLRRHCRTSSLGRRQAAPDAGLCRVLGLLDGITAIGVDEVQFQSPNLPTDAAEEAKNGDWLPAGGKTGTPISLRFVKPQTFSMSILPAVGSNA